MFKLKFLKNFEISTLSYVLALNIFHVEDIDKKLIKTIKQGIIEQRKNNFIEAEDKLHMALEIATNQQNYKAVTYLYDLLGNIAYQSGNYLKAQKLFKDTLQRIVDFDHVNLNDPAFLEVSLKLANIFSKIGDIESAESGYKYCLEKCEQNVKLLDNNKTSKIELNYQDNYQLLGMIYHDYAKHLIEKDINLDLAINILRKSLEIALSFDVDHSLYKIDFTSYFNDYNKPKTPNTQEVDVKESNPLIPVLYNDLAVALEKIGNLDGAIENLEKALQMAEKLRDKSFKRFVRRPLISTTKTELDGSEEFEELDAYEKFKLKQFIKCLDDDLLTYNLNLAKLYRYKRFVVAAKIPYDKNIIKYCRNAISLYDARKSDLPSKQLMTRVNECTSYLQIFRNQIY